MYSKNGFEIVVLASIIVIIVIIVIYLIRYRHETYIPVSNVSQCRVTTVVSQSDAFNSHARTLENVDSQTLLNYTNALQTYQSKVSNYNNLPMCSSLCLGGTLNTSGYCICPSSAPVAYINNGIVYCVPNDFTQAVINNTMIFNNVSGSFECSPGFSQCVTGDNNCYNQQNREAMINLTNTIRSNNFTASGVIGAYGKIGSYFIAGQSSIPTLSLIGSSNFTKTADCINNMPNLSNTPTVFTYNPQTGVCNYYTGTLSFASLQPGNLTVGTITP